MVRSLVSSLAGRAAMLVVAAALSMAAPAARAQTAPGPAGSQKRIALVVGNAAYQGAPLATAANDAGLVAQTLQAAGFDVVGARDLDEDSLRRALRDFVDKAASSGPDTVAFVYLAGYGVQLDGENYIVPVDGKIAAAADVPASSLRVSDYTKRLASVPLKARFVVLDAARTNPFARGGEPLAGGLALTEADPGSLIAFNAAPGTVGPAETGSYGAYAEALVEMIREGGLQPAELFDRVRLRVSERTKGAEVPWDASRIEAPFVFFERAADAPPAGRPAEVAALRNRPIREIGAQDAFAVCLERDSLQGYQDFLGAYPQDPMAKRVRAILAARREALTWRRALGAGSPEAFWSYLGRYPRGPHAFDARRRLSRLAAALEPPPSYTPLVFDVPPPPVEEIVYVERPALSLDDPVYDFAAPPPPPVFFLPPRPAYIVDLAPPPPPDEVYALPVPAFVPVPVYVSAPAYVAAPPNAVIYENIHNTTVIDEINAASLRRGPGLSPGAAIGAGAVVGAAAGLAAARVALPPAVAQKAALPQGAGPGQIFQGQGSRGQGKSFGAPAALQGAPAQGLPAQGVRPGAPALGQPLPGFNGAGAPQQGGRPGVPVQGLPAQGRIPGQVPAGPGQIPMQAVGKGQGQPVAPPAARSVAPGQPPAAAAIGKGVPGRPVAGQPPGAANPATDPRQAAQSQKLQMMQQRQQALSQQRQVQAQQAQAARAQRQMQAQRAAVQQQGAAQRQQLMMQHQQQQAGRQQQMMQQRQMQAQPAQAARQQQMQAIQQQQAMQRQMQAQQAARQQQMMQQRAAPAPRTPPPQAVRCPPGQHCR